MPRTAAPKPEQVPADSKPTLDAFTKDIGFTPDMMATSAQSPIVAGACYNRDALAASGHHQPLPGSHISADVFRRQWSVAKDGRKFCFAASKLFLACATGGCERACVLHRFGDGSGLSCLDTSPVHRQLHVSLVPIAI